MFQHRVQYPHTKFIVDWAWEQTGDLSEVIKDKYYGRDTSQSIQEFWLEIWKTHGPREYQPGEVIEVKEYEDEILRKHYPRSEKAPFTVNAITISGGEVIEIQVKDKRGNTWDVRPNEIIR